MIYDIISNSSLKSALLPQHNDCTILLMQLLHPWQQSAVQVVTYVWDARGSKIPRTRNIAQWMEEYSVYDIEQLICEVLEFVNFGGCQ